jgi:transcriptional regulator with XRE-family HTH domain
MIFNVDRKELGEWLRTMRERTGKTQTSAAVDSGVTKAFLSSIECGKSLPTKDILRSLVKLYGIPKIEMIYKISDMVEEDLSKTL